MIAYRLAAATAAAVLAASAFGAGPDLATTPASGLTFAYQIGGSAPAAQTLAIKSTSAVALAFTAVVTQPAACSGACVILSATSGTTPASLQIYANPTGLAAGAYVATIALNAPAATTPNHTITLTMNVSNPPSTLSASATTATFSYTTGSLPLAQSQNITLGTTGDALTAAVTVAGGTWLKASPTGTVAMLGMPKTLTITADATGLAPASAPYKGTVTVSSSTAANKSIVINVSFTVSSGIPSIAATNGIWPPGAPAGSASPVTITISGTNFTSGSTAASGSTALGKITFINTNTILATIPASLLASAGTIPIVVTTPTAASPSAPATFTVYDPSVPQVWAVVNSASYNQGVVSPGEIVTIYGAGLGPAGVTSYSGSSLPTSLGVSGANTSVTIDGIAAPLLYTSPTQVSCVVPLGVAPGSASGSSVPVKVTYAGATTSVATKVIVTAADPGIFTIGGSTQGAILNINTSVTPADFTVNSTSSPAHPGGWVAIYVTGFGATSCADAPSSPCGSPAPTAADFVKGGTVTPTGTVAVTIGGQSVDAPVGIVPVGSVIGLLQVNAQIPATVAAGDAVPVVVSIGGNSSTGTATMAIK
jgi:uncharacterized protein (TIGR03437 family)